MVESDEKRTVPYTKVVTITKLFEILEHKRAPGVVDGEWAKALQLEPRRPASIPNLFRWLGVTDEKGEPDKDRWDSIRHADTRGEALTGLIRGAYSDLFDATDAEKETREQLKREFARVYNLGDATERVACFLKLCEVAGMEMSANGSASTSSANGTRSTKAPRTATGDPAKKAKKQQSKTPRPAPPSKGVTFAVNLDVEIPAEWSEEQIVERVRAVQRAVERP